MWSSTHSLGPEWKTTSKKAYPTHCFCKQNWAIFSFWRLFVLIWITRSTWLAKSSSVISQLSFSSFRMGCQWRLLSASSNASITSLMHSAIYNLQCSCNICIQQDIGIIPRNTLIILVSITNNIKILLQIPITTHTLEAEIPQFVLSIMQAQVQ